MVIFPIIALVVSAACCAVITRDAIRKPKPDRVVWAIAFSIFAIAAGAEVIGSTSGWSAPLGRLYYLTGAVLVVGYLALGELYLLAKPRIERFAPGVTLLVTALAITLVVDTPIDMASLEEQGWDALEPGSALTALTIGINSLGTVVLVGGALYSAWRFRKMGIQRHRMIGCVLIAIGTITVAMGGTLVRFGHHEFLYIAMSIGVVIIFAGVLETRRSGEYAGLLRGIFPLDSRSGASASAGHLVSFPPNGRPPQRSAGVRYIEEQLLPLGDTAIAEQCRRWSVPIREIDELERHDARLVWQLRTRLSEEGRARFDQLPVAIQGQLAELLSEVLIDPEHVARSG